MQIVHTVLLMKLLHSFKIINSEFQHLLQVVHAPIMLLNIRYNCLVGISENRVARLQFILQGQCHCNLEVAALYSKDRGVGCNLALEHLQRERDSSAAVLKRK